jgi:antitoxin FitA-like protein
MEPVTARKTDVQIRGVPVALRERLRRRADSKGLSMSQYVIEILTDLARPTLAEWLATVGKSPPIDLGGKTGADLGDAQGTRSCDRTPRRPRRRARGFAAAPRRRSRAG